MPNMNVLYSRGNLALQTLVAERIAKWGKPERYSEYVTGYKAADNFTGHNADSNGIVHGVDIFVGPGNLSYANADIFTAFLRKEGLKGTIPGHPDRLYYIIYQDRIAGDFSNWEWVGAGYGHWDHVHISTCDLFWGDPAPISYLDYDSTAPWGLSGISTTTPQGSTPEVIKPTPAKKDWFDMATKEELKAALWEVLGDNLSSAAAAKKAGTVGWTIKNGRDHAELANRGAAASTAAVAALRSVVDQLAKGQGVVIDYKKIDASIKAALADGIEITGTIAAKDADK